VRLAARDEALLDGAGGDVAREAMDALVQLGEAFGAEDMVDIGYAHVHAGMAMYLGDVELMEDLARRGARMSVPASSNIANADMQAWPATGAPEKLARLQIRAEDAHRSMGSSPCFTCTPYWAGHWPTWNTHMVSIESGVTVFCNSVLGARSNRDGFFAVYAGITGRYPRFGMHLEENRLPTHRVSVSAGAEGTADFTALGYAIGAELTNAVPLVTGFARRPTLDELDALGVGMATSGGVAMFVLPGVTPPYAEGDAERIGAHLPALSIDGPALRAVYDDFCDGREQRFDIVHLGCPHASFEEMKHYARLLDGKRIGTGTELWITTNRNVRQMARDAGLLAVMERSGAKVISDTCPISCHFARSCSPDPALGVKPPELSAIVVDSAKQARYIRDMIGCPTLFTSTENAVETAVSGSFVPRW
jgi:predicted aconitase